MCTTHSLPGNVITQQCNATQQWHWTTVQQQPVYKYNSNNNCVAFEKIINWSDFSGNARPGLFDKTLHNFTGKLWVIQKRSI